MTELSNPYQSPSSRLADPEPSNPLVPAERWRRFVNLIVDYFGFIIVVVVFFMVIGLVGGRDAITRVQQIPGFIVGSPLMLLYYFSQEALFGRTLGKLVTGTRVVDERGGNPSIPQILGRSLSRFIPFEAFSFFRESSIGWHDSLPRTLVVKIR